MYVNKIKSKEKSIENVFVNNSFIKNLFVGWILKCIHIKIYVSVEVGLLGEKTLCS